MRRDPGRAPVHNAVMTRDGSRVEGITAPDDWYAAGLPHVWLPYAQMKSVSLPLPVAHTKGVRIALTDGRELIDGIASWWTACHGYNHPHIRHAVEAQLASMPHVMFGGMVHEPALALARRLAGMLPGGLDRVFFSDSGSVAVEVALKMAVQFWLNRGVKGRTQFIAFNGGYHGDTTGAMAVSVTAPAFGQRSQSYAMRVAAMRNRMNRAHRSWSSSSMPREK